MMARTESALSAIRNLLPNRKSLLSGFVATAIIGLLSLGLQKLVVEQQKTALTEVLSGRLQLTVDSLRYWADNRFQNIESLIKRNDLSGYLEALNGLDASREALTTSPVQKVVRTALAQEIIRSGYLGYFLINRNRVSIASLRDENIGIPNPIAHQDWFFDRLDSGMPALSHVLHSDVPLPNRNGQLEMGLPTMFVGMPITNATGEVTGYLTTRIAVTHEFSDILRAGQIGSTGETYAFDARGKVLSEPLHDVMLKQFGVPEAEHGESSALFVRDPGFDLTKNGIVPNPEAPFPLTRMAASATRGENGIDLSGYRDYQGVPVVGVWQWLDDFNFGITTEMAYEEAFDQAGQIRSVIWSVAGVAVLVVLFYLFVTDANRRRVEEREKYLRAIMESSGDGIIVIGVDSTIESINEAAARIFGYQTDEVQNRQLEMILPEKERHLHRRLVSSSTIATAQRIAGNRTLYGLHKSGQEVPIELNVSPMMIGNTRKYVGVLRDISERIEAEAKIMQFKAAVDNAVDCIFMFEPNSLKFIYANQGAIRQIGYDVDELMNMTPVDIKPEFTDETFRAKILSILAGKNRTATFQTKHRHKNGTEIPVEISLQYIDEDKADPRFVAFVRDISDRLAKEQVIKRRELTLKSVLDTSAASIALLDEDGRIHEVNETWDRFAEEYGGPSRKAWVGEIYGDVLRRCLKQTDQDSDATLRPLTDVLNGERASWEHVYSCQFPQGQRRWFKKFCRGVDGVPGTRCVVMHFDITEIVEVQDQLKLATEEANRANEEKSRFLATMSHEIRTPMNGIIGMIDLLRESRLNAEQKSMALTIRNSGFSLLSIINDILDLSKIEAGQLQLENIPISVVEVIESVGDMMWLQAEKNGVEILLDAVTDGPERIYGDPTRLRQIVLNLTSNAIKFSSKLTRKGQVKISTLFEDNADGSPWLNITIEDNGIGMDDAQLANLFRPFTQADSSTTREFGGTGLGLAICHHLADRMGGRIDVNSIPGVGSQFTVRLPSHPAQARGNREGHAIDLKGLRFCLLFPKTAGLQEIVSRALSGRGATGKAIAELGDLSDAPFGNAAGSFDALVVGPELPWDDVMEEIDRIYGAESAERFRIVKLAGNPSEPKGMIHPNRVVVGCHPLKPSEFIQGCAVAVGRISPILNSLAELDADLNDAQNSVTPPSVDEASAEGRLILVAEDHAINRDVIRRQLNRLGYACEMAENGRQALDMWQAGRDYGLLLTDCHMPEMDGYELTREIRLAENANGGSPNLPIVAITANALVGEADRCLAVGMNDYVAKPVEIPRLKHVLKKWLAKNPSDGDDRNPPTTVAAASSLGVESAGPFDFDWLMDLLGCEDGGLDFSLLDAFRKAACDDRDIIEKAMEDRNAMALRDACHAANGAARSAGAVRLGDALFELQNRAASGSWPDIGDALELVRSEFAEIEKWFVDRAGQLVDG